VSAGRARAVQALVSVVDETRLLFHRLKRTAESLHRQGETTAGRRGVLQSLKREGPQTVPQLARARPVSRQHIQKLVDPLAEEGLVELVDNPRHKRSRLVRLTDSGRRLLGEIDRRERPVLQALAEELDAEELERAAAALARLRGLLADRRIRELVERTGR
jgi:DNA-binding MarR family transcriptional regulator